MAWLRVLILAIALVHASGLSDALSVACGDDCAEQDCDEGCPPICPSCHCARCPAAIAVDAAAAVSGGRRAVDAGFRAPERVPSCPDPGEILRVPIARGA